LLFSLDRRFIALEDMAVRLVRHTGIRHNAAGPALVPGKTVEARQLLGGIIGSIPSAVGSLPLLGPVLSGGGNSPAPAPPSAPTPQSASPPSSTGGSSGGSSSGSPSPGSGGGSSSGGSTSVNGGGGRSGGNPSPTTAGTPSSPSTDTGTSTGFSQPTDSASRTAGGSVSTVNGSSSSSSTAQNAGSQSTSHSGSQAPNGVNDGNQSLPDTIQSGMNSSPNSPSGIAAAQSTSTNVPLAGGGSSALSNNTKHRLASGTIAGIVVVLVILLFLFLLVFFLRRRSKMQRADRRNKWWFATNRPPQKYGDITTAEIVHAGTRTARSSFVTTVDHSEAAHAHATHIIPPFPPAMAEMGRGNALRPALIINTYDEDKDPSSDVRFSIGSAGSDHSQYLIVHNRNSANPDILGGNTPMSVRPFSPSESFAFPKPPEPAAGSVAGSRPSSSAMSAKFSTTSLNASPPPGLPVIPSLPFTMPFTPFNKGDPPSPTATIMARSVDPFADNNPFEDPSTSNTTPTTIYSGFSETEVVRRPFIPTLSDELSVIPGDSVRVLHNFDDGWALVERTSQGYHGNGRRDGGESAKGLIPVDCLRKPGQELPAFIASKRLSSYGEPPMAY